MSAVGTLSVLVASEGSADFFVAAEVLLQVVTDRRDEIVVLHGLAFGCCVLS